MDIKGASNMLTKNGLTAVEAGAPTIIKNWVISEAEQKLLDEYSACFAEPTGAPTNAERYERTINKQFTDRLDTYLKERG